ncbi:MAG: hypothetical protein ACYTEL_25400 [Planctomycetota bacterium]|jgi:hypothetical protein
MTDTTENRTIGLMAVGLLLAMIVVTTPVPAAQSGRHGNMLDSAITSVVDYGICSSTSELLANTDQLSDPAIGAGPLYSATWVWQGCIGALQSAADDATDWQAACSLIQDPDWLLTGEVHSQSEATPFWSVTGGAIRLQPPTVAGWACLSGEELCSSDIMTSSAALAWSARSSGF